MTFDQAETILKEVFPATYLTLRYERGVYSTGEPYRAEIKAYANDVGWTGDQPTFEAAIHALVLMSEGTTSPSEGIHD